MGQPQRKETLVVEKSSLKKQVGGDHYKTLKMQPIDYIVANDLSWCEGNIVKYATRHKVKGGRADIEKVIHYAEMLLELEYPEDEVEKFIKEENL